MKPEEFEVYVIPPNFMEGGTLFGGLLKTRNTIEAVILGLAVGVPVLHLPFSLTVRVVILCLTALPLVLLALIGVSGMSLSAFIRLFFCFLHNRRILSRDGTQGGKNGKTLLPSWAQQRKSDCEAEDPPLPKSRSRFSVDLKQRSVTQFKTFLQEEEAVQPLNALADYIPIEKIEHGVIYTRDHRYVTDCRQVGENIHQIPLLYLAQQKTALAETLVYSWSKSAGHMENMTDESYAAIGVGLARGTDANGLECWYCVQLFLRSGYSISAVDKPATK